MTTSSLWYRLADMAPPYNVHVHVQFEGRQIKAVRGVHKGRDVWAEVMRGGGLRTVVLPVAASVVWQPLSPEKWRLPLPEPIVGSIVTGMTRTTQSFTAVDAALAAEEMEADRDAIRAGGEIETDDPMRRWWADLSAIRYEPKGEVSRRMVEGRVMRALADCGAGQAPVAGGVAATDALAALSDAARRALAADDGSHWLVRFKPLVSDNSDFLEAMRWWTALNPPELWAAKRKPWTFSRAQRALFWRAIDEPLTWSEIGFRFKLSARRAQQVYETALDKCHRVANGRPPDRHRNPVDHIAALRERNREARRSA